MTKETQLSVFLRNVPGELGRFAEMMGEANINILAMFIQNAADYVQDMFAARGRSIKRTASAASYGSVIKEAKEYSLVRVVVDQTDKALGILQEDGYWVHTCDVLVMELQNHPGKLAKTSRMFGDAAININYVYGSGSAGAETAMYVFNVQDAQKALKSLSRMQ
jgi:hypothetical protein